MFTCEYLVNYWTDWILHYSEGFHRTQDGFILGIKTFSPLIQHLNTEPPDAWSDPAIILMKLQL